MMAAGKKNSNFFSNFHATYNLICLHQKAILHKNGRQLPAAQVPKGLEVVV